MGSGRFAKKLPYKEWFEFNVAQRIAYNYLEHIQMVLVWIMVSGLRYPYVSIGSGIVYFIGRLIYTVGYSRFGPNGRFAGVLFCFLSILVMFVVSIMSCLSLQNYI